MSSPDDKHAAYRLVDFIKPLTQPGWRAQSIFGICKNGPITQGSAKHYTSKMPSADFVCMKVC